MKNHLHRGQIRGAKIKNGTGGNAKLDRRHDRRALNHEEAEWLLRTTRQAKTRWKLSGIQRFWLYRLAMATGLRASELASLTPESFGGGQVTINAASAKNRRKDSIPLAEYLIKEVAEWLAPLPANKPVWPGAWTKQPIRWESSQGRPTRSPASMACSRRRPGI